MKTQLKATKNTPKEKSAPEQTVKRRVGRPPKSETSVSASRTRGVKTAAAKQSRLTAKKAGASTRELIISSANEIINRTGVVDFRIETLAQSLSLSPGNITYHFPKKEDIITAIWEEYLEQTRETPADLITPLLDIKQLFLYFRTIASKALNYVGVTTYFFGDMGALTRENAVFRKQVEDSRNLFFEAYDMLHQNGYMHPIQDRDMKEITFESQFTTLRWWINYALSKYPQQELPARMDHYIALALLALQPYLTDNGKSQLKSIINLIK